MKILISYDGSSCAQDALKELRRAGLPEQADVLVVSVAEQWRAPAGSSGQALDVSDLADSASALKVAEDARAKLWADFPGWTIEAEGKVGSVSTQVVKSADEWGADLVVVGSHGLNAAERFVFGSISQQLVTNAHSSVRVARGNPHREDQPIRLLVGVDGSSDSNVAVDEILNRHWPEHTKVWLTTAVNSYFEEDANVREREESAKLHEEIAERMKERGLSTTSIIDNLDPKYLILRTASDMEIDCIFMGARGLSRFERTLLGSVSAAISARAHCSVEVVRRRGV
ncbi:MAG: universal stress protein [Ignavibacteriae bacterium]|nr:universal stress protein [Ignavibacteriota bacterium]MCB9214818.1 universal stress protein [Ignavibacteria bacterium]